MLHDLKQIEDNAIHAIEHANSLDALETVRVAYLGRKGALSLLLRTIKTLDEKERSEIGKTANDLRTLLERCFDERAEALTASAQLITLKKEWLDITRPGRKPAKGHLHPITIVLNEIIHAFGAMGFSVIEGPEVESEYYNFDALNIPADHPARDMWDTFWINKSTSSSRQNTLLRTHTSPVQVRFMEQYEPPFRIIVPGRVYRYEASDASHDIQFYQVEGLVVDRNITIANFKSVMLDFFTRLLAGKTEIRLRPSYFPFTEPSFEVDVACVACARKGCSICKRTGWLELAGAGMVHPNVFKSAGYLPHEWTGFAFGMGIDRLAMIKYGIPDIRLFHSGDIRFLRQF